MNFQNLTFIKTKKNYKILTKSKNTEGDEIFNKIIVVSPPINCNFGIEEYNYKYIINFELTDLKKNNNIYNFHSFIKSLDNYFVTTAPQKIKEIQNKTYISCIKSKKENLDPLLRIHLKNKNQNIITIFKNKDNNIISSSDIKNKKCKCQIEIGPLWYTDTNYGIILYLNELII
jgi:hypothetical protein